MTTVCAECSGKRLDLSATIFFINYLTRSVPQQSKILLVFSLTFDVFGFEHFQGVVKMKPPFWKVDFRDIQLSFFSALEGMIEINHIKSFVDESNSFLPWGKLLSRKHSDKYCVCWSTACLEY